VWVDATTRVRDGTLFKRLLAEHPIDYERYWRELTRWN
jgi:hypothetical protein